MKIFGKKRQVLVDTHGLLIHAIVHAADIQSLPSGLTRGTAMAAGGDGASSADPALRAEQNVVAGGR